MPVTKGTKKIESIHKGTTEITRAYKGENLVFQKCKSYYIANGITYSFELSNTPVTNFCNNGGTAASITINGTSVVKNTITSIVFGDTYNSVTSIPENFLHTCGSLTSVNLRGLSGVTSIGNYILNSCKELISIDLSGFSNVTSIENYFLYNCNKLTSVDLNYFSKIIWVGTNFLRGCASLTSVDLSCFSKINSIENHFLYNCSELVSIQIRNVDWSSKTVSTYNFMINVPNTSSCTLYANTTALANTFKSKMNGKISNWRIVIN